MDITANNIKKPIKTVLLTGWLLLLMLPAQPILAQQSDTTNYFPFETGDIWVYDVCESIFCEAEVRVEVTSDSINKEGVRWLRTEELYSDEFETRLDTVEYRVDSVGNIYRKPWPMDPSYPGFALVLNDTATIGESWIADSARNANDHKHTLFAQVEDTMTRVIFNDTTEIITMAYSPDLTFFPSLFFNWARGLGIIEQTFSEPGLDYSMKGVFKGGKLLGDTTLVYVSTEEEVENLPRSIRLHQNYPNPFNPSTTIRFDLRRATQVSLSIYDITGRKITTLLNQQLMSSGRHQVVWNAGQTSSGIYFYRLKVNGRQITRKMMLIK